MSYAGQFGDFMSGDFMSGDFLTGYHIGIYILQHLFAFIFQHYRASFSRTVTFYSKPNFIITELNYFMPCIISMSKNILNKGCLSSKIVSQSDNTKLGQNYTCKIVLWEICVKTYTYAPKVYPTRFDPDHLNIQGTVIFKHVFKYLIIILKKKISRTFYIGYFISWLNEWDIVPGDRLVNLCPHRIYISASWLKNFHLEMLDGEST